MSFMEEFDHLKIVLKDIISATDNFSYHKRIGRGGFGVVYKGELEGKMMAAFKCLDGSIGQWNIDSLTWRHRLNICVEAACALSFLYAQPIETDTRQRVVHQDFKSSNILLDENWTAKVSNFGMSKTHLLSNVVGTPGYCDPLAIETGFLSEESDVYSFGVVLFELSLINDSIKRPRMAEIVKELEFAIEQLEDFNDLGKKYLDFEEMKWISDLAVVPLTYNSQSQFYRLFLKGFPIADGKTAEDINE
uniref:Protein kinase domain-containing protein n=1 Tax=Lactuca sativa TaxID=4236 RepID=A0A9R1XIU6_LACSA|nr:hypothetical protein LSAT_V11C300114640 [Lactuca sativa]